MAGKNAQVEFQPIGTYPFPIASTEFSKHMSESRADIFDIRQYQEVEGSEEQTSIHAELKNGPEKRSEHGAIESLAKEVTRSLGSPEEVKALQAHAQDIAHEMLPGTIILELGTVNADKTRLLLDAVESQHKIVDYYALDSDRDELEQNVKDLLSGSFRYVRCHGLLGTIADAKTWVAKWESRQRPKYLLSLGPRTESAQDWRRWVDALQSSNEDRDRIVLGIGVNKDAVAENGEDAAVDEEWTLRTEWDASIGRLVRYLVARRDGRLEDRNVTQGEKILITQEYRYDEGNRGRFLQEGALQESQKFLSKDGTYGLYVLSPLRKN